MHNRCTCLHACFCFSFGSTQLFILLDATYSGLLAIHVFTQGEAWWLKEHSAPFGANINAFDAAIFDCCSRLTFAPLPRWRWLRLRREDVDGGFINPLTLRLRHEGVDPTQLDFVVVEPYPHLVALPSRRGSLRSCSSHLFHGCRNLELGGCTFTSTAFNGAASTPFVDPIPYTGSGTQPA